MEIMIDSNVVKTHRKNRSWSQDQLAAVADVSLRTIQRIEKEGACSLESAKAIASAFEVEVSSLQINESEQKYHARLRNARLYSFLGATLGFICAVLAITYAFVNGELSSGEAGVYFGMVGLISGLSYLALVFLMEYFRKHKVGQW